MQQEKRRICAYCGMTFAAGGNQIYCGEVCAGLAAEERRRQARVSATAKRVYARLDAIAALAKKAEGAGCSYGAYVSRQAVERAERVVRRRRASGRQAK